MLPPLGDSVRHPIFLRASKSCSRRPVEVSAVAQHVRVELVDDLDGSPAQETIEFGLDGLLYQIDLSTVNADQLRAAFAPYIAGARRSAATAASAAKKVKQ